MQEPGNLGKGIALHTVQHHDYAVLLRQFHHGAEKRAVAWIRRQGQPVQRVRNEFFCCRKLIFAVVDCQLCQERAFPAGIDRERLLQQPAEDCL